MKIKHIKLQGMLFLLICLLLTTAFVHSDEWMAAVRFEGMVTDVALPVHEHLSDLDGNEYAFVVSKLDALYASGYEYELVTPYNHETTYHIAMRRYAEAERYDGKGILYSLGETLILDVPGDTILHLADNGYEIKVFNDRPAVRRPVDRSLIPQDIEYDPAVNAVIGKITSSQITDLGNRITGEKQVTIEGSPYTITTRASWYDNDMMKKATQYAYEYMSAQDFDDVGFHYWSLIDRNIVGEIRGSVFPDELVILVAHYDCAPSAAIAPGADDNGSGSIAAMLAAKYLPELDFQRTIRIILVTGEEQGLHGSRKYAKELYEAGENVVAVINMDMMGWDSNNDGKFNIYTRKPSDPGHAGDMQITNLFLDTMETYGMAAKLEPMLLETGPLFSDHAAFWENGFPCMMMCEQYYIDETPYYHSPQDRMSTLNIGYLTNLTKTSIAAVAHLAKVWKGGPTPTPQVTPTPTRTPQVTATPNATPVPVNIALGKPVTVSSTYAQAYPGTNAVDGSAATVWGSTTGQAQDWIYVDLGKVTEINGIGLDWYGDYYATTYYIYSSNDKTNWTNHYKRTKTGAGPDTYSGFSLEARYLAILCTAKNSVAIGLSEFAIYRLMDVTPTPSVTPTPQPSFTPDPNVTPYEGMIAVSGGTFTMGDTFGSGKTNESPAHQVSLSNFYIGRSEVTQKDWTRIMGTNPSSTMGDLLPVESVSWHDVIRFCNKLSLVEGLVPCYSVNGSVDPDTWPNTGESDFSPVCNWQANGYRLPTEAEWEYAARGGSSDTDPGRFSGSENLDSVGWFALNSGSRTHDVMTKAANELGLYDMSGNVWEWVWDYYGTYPSGSVTDPNGPASGNYRIKRGGSCFYGVDDCTVPRRISTNSTSSHLGFRISRSSNSIK